jgi:hypothetical protein
MRHLSPTRRSPTRRLMAPTFAMIVVILAQSAAAFATGDDGRCVE